MYFYENYTKIKENQLQPYYVYAEKGGTNPTKDDIVTVHYAGHGDHYIADHPKGLIMNPDIPSVYGVMGDATKEIIVDGSTITLYSVAIHGVVWVKGVADIRVGQKVMPCQKNLKIIAPLFDRNCQNATYEAGNYNILGYVLDVEVKGSEHNYKIYLNNTNYYLDSTILYNPQIRRK